MSLLLNSTVNMAIPLALLGVFVLFVLSGMLWGIIRGLKKQSFRLVWIFVIALILFFVTPVITNAIMNLNVSFIGISVKGVELTTINEFVSGLLCNKEVTGEYAQIFIDNPDVIKAVLQIVTIFFNAILYVLFFWLVKILLWPLWAILSAIFIKKKNKDKTKKKKYRAWGMLVGVFLGIFVGATTIMPVMGILNIANKVEYETSELLLDKDGNVVTDKNGKQLRTGKNGFFTKNLSAEVGDLIRAYDKSVPLGVLRYTGIEFFNGLAFDALSTTKVNNQNIVLKNEVTSVFKTVDSFSELKNYEFKNYHYQKLTKLIDIIETATNNMFEINTINVIGDKLLPYVINEMLTNDEFVIKLPASNDKILNYTARETLTQIKDIKYTDLKNEVHCILNICKILNKNDLLALILNNEIKETDVWDYLSEEDATALTDQIYEMKTLGTAMPVILNAVFWYIAESLDVTNFKVEEQVVSVEEVKNLTNALINISLKAYNTIDTESKYYVTNQTFGYIGQILDAIVAYPGLGTENYKKIITAVENRLYDSLESMLDDLDESFNDFKEPLLSSVHNLNKITKFEEELTKVGNVFDNAIRVYESYNGGPELNLEDMGAVLDGVKTTTLLGDAIIPVAKATFKLIKNELPQELNDMKPILERISNNVEQVSSWQQEFKTYQKLFSTFSKMATDVDVEQNILKDDNTYFSELGESVNSLDNSTLFGKEIKNLVKVIIDYAESLLPEGTNIANGAFIKINNNLTNATNIDWKLEFETIKELALVANDFNDVTVPMEKVGERIDNVIAKNSKLINREVITEVLVNAVDDFAKDITDLDTLKIVNKIKTIIVETTDLSYKQEIVALNTLINEITRIDIDNFNYARFGRMLDEFDISSDVRPSVIISPIRADLVKLIIGKIDTTDFPQDLVDIINKIKSNVDNITNYQNEFTYLKKFVDKAEELKVIEVATFDFVGFGAFLDEFDNSVLLGNVRHDVVVMILNEAEKSTDDQELKEMIIDIKNAVPNITSFEEEFKHLKEFIDIRDDVTSGSITGISWIGKKLDDFGNSVLLRPIRFKLFDKLLTQTIITEGNLATDVIIAINDINAQTRVCAQKVERGELSNNGQVMTYQLIFSEFEGLKDIFDILKEVKITKENYVLSPFGTCLDALSKLNVVPLKSTVRMHKFVLTELRTIIESWYTPVASYATEEINNSYKALNNKLSVSIEECVNYLDLVNSGNEASYSKSFVNEYSEIEQLIASFVNAIKNAIIS